MLWLLIALCCAAPVNAPVTAPVTAPVEPVVSAYTLSLPGVLPAETYAVVRADAVLGPALDQALLPALAVDAPPAARVAQFLAARDRALAERAKQPAPAGPPRVPSAEALAAGPIGPMAAQDPVLVAFERVCTDVLRTWFRSYAAHLARQPQPLAERTTQLEALQSAATTAFPWSLTEGRSASVEVMLEAAAARERE